MYIHTVLKHGFGFPGPSRSISFVLDVEGMEVEWTLGFALAELPFPTHEEGPLGLGLGRSLPLLPSSLAAYWKTAPQKATTGAVLFTALCAMLVMGSGVRRSKVKTP